MLDELPGLDRKCVEATQADAELPRRPGIGEPRHAQAHRGSAPTRRGLGDDGDADTVLDHAADGIEAAQPHTQLERPAGLDGMLREMLLQRARRVEADKIMVEQVPEMVAAAAGRIIRLSCDACAAR